MQTDSETSPLARLYDLDKIVGDPSKKTLDAIVHEFALEMATTSEISYEVAKDQVEKTVVAMLAERNFKGLSSLGNPQVKLNRHQRRKQAKLERKYSTRNKS